MKKRLQKKAEKHRRQGIHKVLDLVLDINGLDKRDREFTGNLPTAFFSFSGHVATINVDIHPQGWDGERWDSELNEYIRMNARIRKRECDKIIRRLENFKKEKDPGDGHLQRSNT